MRRVQAKQAASPFVEMLRKITFFDIFRRKMLTKNVKFAKIKLVLTFFQNRVSCLQNGGSRSDFPNRDSPHATNLTERGTTQVKQRNMNLIANQVAVDLHGPRGTQHIRCAFGPFVAPSCVPICLDTQIRTPLTAAGVDAFSSDSIGHLRLSAVFNPAKFVYTEVGGLR